MEFEVSDVVILEIAKIERKLMRDDEMGKSKSAEFRAGGRDFDVEMRAVEGLRTESFPRKKK